MHRGGGPRVRHLPPALAAPRRQLRPDLPAGEAPSGPPPRARPGVGCRLDSVSSLAPSRGGGTRTGEGCPSVALEGLQQSKHDGAVSDPGGGPHLPAYQAICILRKLGCGHGTDPRLRSCEAPVPEARNRLRVVDPPRESVRRVFSEAARAGPAPLTPPVVARRCWCRDTRPIRSRTCARRCGC